MIRPQNLLANGHHWRYIAGTTLIGIVVLVSMSVIQKWLIGTQVLSLVGYVVPALFGGGTGFVYGYFSIGRKRRIRALERESEIRRLISVVNHTLVGAESIEDMATQIADIVGSSPLFNCTYLLLLDTAGVELLRIRNDEREKSTIKTLHTDRYADSVFDSQALRIADVTEAPYQHHEDSHPHSGVGIAIGHDGVDYGILTVHFPDGVEPTADEIELLETIGSDLGYFIHNRFVESERQAFAEIVERIDDPVMIQNRDGSFRVVNEALTEFAGLDKSSVQGADEYAFMDETSASTVEAMKNRVIETETPVSYQITPTFPDGRERSFSTTRYPSFDDQGAVDGTIAICRDVTDLQAHQRQLRVLDRVLRHNVNNNMNVVQGYAEMISEQSGGELSNYARKITENSTRLLDIAHKQRQITDFLAKSEPIQSTDLRPLLTRIAAQVQDTYPQADVTVTCPGGITVWATKSIADGIEEVLTNSIIHSSRATPTPTITVRRVGTSVQIRIADENTPISDMDRAVLDGVDEISALRHGSGLGLWLVKLIVDHSDGTVSYEENDPRGNIVTIELESTTTDQSAAD